MKNKIPISHLTGKNSWCCHQQIIITSDRRDVIKENQSEVGHVDFEIKSYEGNNVTVFNGFF